MKKATYLESLPAVFLLVLISFLQSLQAQDKPSDKLPLDPQVKVGKLPNGLTYYIRKNVKPENKVELRLVVNAGSILEDDDQQGLAHFAEHMAFNGSANFEKNDIVSFLQSIGVEFGADLNAYTGFDETVYILPIPTEKKENVEKAFQILDDWASAVSFDPGEIDKERGVVLEEERSGRGAEERMFRQTYPKMLEGSKYADRLPIGKVEVLKSFKPEVIRRFYKDWYRPDLMAVIVVGDMDPAEAERLIKNHFSDLKNPANPRPREKANVPTRKESEALVVTDKEATNHLIDINYPYKTLKDQNTLGAYREYLLRNLFASMLSQRMQELIQKENPPFLYAANYFGSLARGYEGYNAYAYLGKGGVEPAINALVAENERARKFGFTANELDRTKKMMLKSIERAYNERDKTESANLTEEYIRHFLEEEPIPGIENEYKYYQKFLDEIKLEEVNKYVSQTIPSASEPKLVILTGPEKADFKIPGNTELLTMAEKAFQQETKPYEEKAIASTLMETVPKAGKITGEKKNAALDFTELTLSNGIKVIAKPTDFKNDQVILNASRLGGHYNYDAADRYNAEFAATIVTQMGVGNFSPTDLRKVLAGKNAGVTPRIGSVSEGINGQCSATDVETMLQLVHLYFTQPRKDTELFNSFVSKQQAMYQNMAADPQYTFQESMLETLYKGHPWAPRLPKPETFSEIKLDRSLEIYKDRFSDANGFTFVLVGKIDMNTLKPLLETYLGSLPSTGKSSAYKDVGLRPAKGPLKKEVNKGTEPKSLIRLLWNGEAKYSEEEQFKIQGLVEVMNIKIIETLREDLSGIYGGGMNGSMSKYPYNSYSFGITVPCGPENVDKLIAATLAEIEKVKNNGPSEADLNKVKETWKQQYLVSIKDNGFWARQILQSIETGSDPGRLLTYEQRVDALTPKDVQEMAKKYLDLNNYLQFILNPEG
ncbi:MAG: insulinase family protein [Cyclobacteriaceae bacterium]